MKTILLHTIAAAALLAATPAFAQDDSDDNDGDWLLAVGPGALFKPDYPGADSYRISPLPILGLRRTGEPLAFEAPDEGAGFGLLGDDGLIDFGPAVVFQSKRRERDVGAPVGNVGFTFEAGAFVELQFSESFRLRAEGRQGLGGHDGLLGDLSADFVVRNDNSYVFSIGPRARWADNDYHDAYYGVTPAVALAAGVPTFDAASGFYAIGAAAGLTVMLGERWGIEAQAGYDRLINDAADSPITRAFGSRNQYSAGLGLFYEFNVGDIF